MMIVITIAITKLTIPESVQTLINFITHFRGANSEQKEPYWRQTKNHKDKKDFGPRGIEKFARLMAALLTGAKKILSDKTGRYLDNEKLRAAMWVGKALMSWTDFQATDSAIINASGSHIGDKPESEWKTVPSNYPCVVNAFRSWTKDNQLWLLKGCLHNVQDEMFPTVVESDTADVQANAKATRNTMMGMEPDVFATCCVPCSNEFLRSLKDHQVKCTMTSDTIAKEVFKLAMVKEYLATKGANKTQLMSSYKRMFGDFCSYKDILPRRRLIVLQNGSLHPILLSSPLVASNGNSVTGPPRAA